MQKKENGNEIAGSRKIDEIVEKIQNSYWAELQLFLDQYQKDHGIVLSLNGTHCKGVYIPITDSAFELRKFTMQTLRIPGTNETMTFQGSMFMSRCKYLLPDAARMVLDYLLPDAEETPSKKLVRYGKSIKTMASWMRRLGAVFSNLIPGSIGMDFSVMLKSIFEACHSLEDYITYVSESWRKRVISGNHTSFVL